MRSNFFVTASYQCTLAQTALSFPEPKKDKEHSIRNLLKGYFLTYEAQRTQRVFSIYKKGNAYDDNVTHPDPLPTIPKVDGNKTIFMIMGEACFMKDFYENVSDAYHTQGYPLPTSLIWFYSDL
jgi:hypothetical protein